MPCSADTVDGRDALRARLNIVRFRHGTAAGQLAPGPLRGTTEYRESKFKVKLCVPANYSGNVGPTGNSMNMQGEDMSHSSPAPACRVSFPRDSAQQKN